MDKAVTAVELQNAAMAAGVEVVPHHCCSVCGEITHYIVTPSGGLWFDSNCNCTGWTGPDPRTWEDAAAWVNMQTDAAHRDRIAKSFGLPGGQ